MLLMLGTLLAMILVGEWQIAFWAAIGMLGALYVGMKVFAATERGDFPGFIEDMFPDEIDEIKRREGEHESGRSGLRDNHNHERRGP